MKKKHIVAYHNDEERDEKLLVYPTEKQQSHL